MSDLIRHKCPFCDKTIGVRPNQLGRRVRCPNCKNSFSIALAAVASPADMPPTDQEQPPEPAPDANELIRAPRSEWPRARMNATFPHSRDMVFQACVQAARSGGANVLSVDRTNHHLRFVLESEASRSEHELFVFDAVGGAADVEVSSDAANTQYRLDDFYRAMFAELSKFLMFVPTSHHAASAPPPSPPAPIPPPPAPPSVVVYNNQSYDDRDDDRYLLALQSRRRQGSDGLGIAGFVCGLVGTVLSCIPLLAGGLGVLAVVFGAISLGSGKKKNGFGVASLTLGIVACVLALCFFAYWSTRYRPYYD